MITVGDRYHYNNHSGTDAHFTVTSIESGFVHFTWEDGSRDVEPQNTSFWNIARLVGVQPAEGSESAGRPITKLGDLPVLQDLKKKPKGISKTDIIELMKTVTYRTGKLGYGVFLNEQALNKLYDEWKTQLQYGNNI